MLRILSKTVREAAEYKRITRLQQEAAPACSQVSPAGGAPKSSVKTIFPF